VLVKRGSYLHILGAFSFTNLTIVVVDHCHIWTIESIKLIKSVTFFFPFSFSFCCYRFFMVNKDFHKAATKFIYLCIVYNFCTHCTAQQNFNHLPCHLQTISVAQIHLLSIEACGPLLAPDRRVLFVYIFNYTHLLSNSCRVSTNSPWIGATCGFCTRYLQRSVTDTRARGVPKGYKGIYTPKIAKIGLNNWCRICC